MKNYLNILTQKESEDTITHTLIIGSVFGLIGLIGYPLTVTGGGLKLVFLGLLISIASFIAGLFTGCLFGMPKRNPDENSNYTLNNSLVEISDWLTKIIVGLGLVNLLKLPEYLTSMGFFIQKASGIKGNAVELYAICLIIFFSIFGLYHGYNYMRLVLSQKYKESDDNLLHKVQKELKSVKNEFEKQKTIAEEKETLNQSLFNVINKSDKPLEITRTEIIKELVETRGITDEAELELRINNMVKLAHTKTKNGQFTNKTDPQNGQWGGKTSNNHRQVKAIVSEKAIGLFRIKVLVNSTDPDNYPIPDGEVVLFALHDSFGDPPVRLIKAENGCAELSLISYGSFTIGVLIDYGTTELEINLAQVPGVSEYFQNH